MSQPVKNVVSIGDFGGILSNADPHDQKQGTSPDMSNLTCIRVGEMRVRSGYLQVIFEEEL